MSEEEIMSWLQSYLEYPEIDDPKYIKEAIQGLLDLYQKEKDLNQELQIRYKIENDKYKEEKEKNKKLKKENEELDLKFKYAVPDEIVNELYVSKDKMREFISEYSKIAVTENKNVYSIIEEKDIRKQLLEEENNEM